jgi:histidinol dehydrogenase
VQTASPEGFNNLKETVITLAQAEALDAHEKAVKIREAIAFNEVFIKKFYRN